MKSFDQTEKKAGCRNSVEKLKSNWLDDQRTRVDDRRKVNQQLKMSILEFTFKVLTICGCWRPYTWLTLRKRLAYRAYTIFIILLIHTFMLSQLMDLILMDNANDFTDNFYILLVMIVSCCKMFNLLVNRGNIAMLIDILTRKPCRPIQSDEIEIQQKFDRLVEWVQRPSLAYTWVLGFSWLRKTQLVLNALFFYLFFLMWDKYPVF